MAKAWLWTAIGSGGMKTESRPEFQNGVSTPRSKMPVAIHVRGVLPIKLGFNLGSPPMDRHKPVLGSRRIIQNKHLGVQRIVRLDLTLLISVQLLVSVANKVV